MNIHMRSRASTVPQYPRIADTQPTANRMFRSNIDARAARQDDDCIVCTYVTRQIVCVHRIGPMKVTCYKSDAMSQAHLAELLQP